MVLNDLINDKLKKIRVRACFDCHMYCIVDVNDYKPVDANKILNIIQSM